MTTVWGLFQLPQFQTYTAKAVASFYSNKLGATISINSLEISFFDSIELKELYIEDRSGDSLAYLSNMTIGFDLLDWEGKILNAKIELKEAYLNFYKAESDSVYNYQFLVDYFLVNDRDTSTNVWKYELSSLKLVDANFHLHDYNVKDTSMHINYKHLDVGGLNLFSSKLLFKEAYLKVKIDSLSGHEQNGFYLESLATLLEIDSKKMAFDNLEIKTLGTDLKADIELRANSFAEYSDFNNLVNIKASFKSSKVHIDDIAFFAPPLKGIEDQIFFEGEISGLISNLSGTNIKLKLNEETSMEGDIDLRGLPKVEETFVYLDLKKFKTSAKSLRELPYPPFKENNHIEIPRFFDSLKTILFKGIFTGFYNDFVAYGKVTTALGYLNIDLSLKENINNEIDYKGSLKTSNFDIGRFFGINDLSTISLDIELDGSGYKSSTLNAKANGAIKEIRYKGYNYKDIELNGEFADETFKGKVTSRDDNLNFDFSGLIDFNEESPVSKFNLELKNANLGQLGLFKVEDTLTKLQFKASFNLEGKNIDNIIGEVNIDSLFYSDSEQNYFVENFELIANNEANTRSINLYSSLLDAEVKGDVKFIEIVKDIKNQFYQYIPSLGSKSPSSEAQDFSYKIEFKNSKPLFNVISDDLAVDSGSIIQGKYNNQSRESEFIFTGSQFSYKEHYINDFNISIQSTRDSALANVKANKLKIKGINSLDSFQLSTNLKSGVNLTSVFWNGVNGKRNPSEIYIINQLESFTKMSASFTNSFFTINDSIWIIENSNNILIDTSSVQISNFEISNSSQLIKLKGGVSNDSANLLSLDIENIDLEFISGILPENVIELVGTANGAMQIQDVYNNLSISSDLKLSQLIANGVEIGDAKFKSKWVPQLKAFQLDAAFGMDVNNKLRLNGIVYPFRKKNSLDLKLLFHEFPINLLAPYIEDYITELKGSLNGSVNVTGESSKPIVIGDVNLKNASFFVNYLNTMYSIDDEIIVRPDFIGFDLIKVVDSRKNYAIATGAIFHENYSDFNLDIGLEFEDFLCLNTNSLNNDLFYGKAIASGIANISGYADQLNFEIDLKVEKGTDFKIPLDEGVNVSTSNFLVFTNSPDYDKSKSDIIDLSGIELNFNLSFDPEARVQIIFDDQIGDIIKAQGEGNLKLEINTLGNFNIYGQYVVDKGDYLFTLQNVVNKRFELKKGSRLFWNGNPYQAEIDLKAVYKLRANLYDLLQDTSSGYRKRIPVELELQLTEKLLSPEIEFAINLPTADEQTKQKLESILYTNNNDVNKQEMNQQVFSLLVLNRFMPSAGSGDDFNYDKGAPGINNGYEFLSNQLSNWFSRISDDFDVGVNYRPANELNSEEVDLSLSTEILNDRLLLDGNVGYTGNAADYNPNQNSNFIGEFTAEYKLSKDGRFRVKGFNRSTNNSLIQLNSPYTQGVGLFFREEFDTIGELWRKYFHSYD